MVFGIEPDRIEGIARGLDADRALDPFGAERIQRQREHERLRHRLDGEGNPAVADLVDMAVDGGEADAEMIGVGLAQFRNVVGDRAAVLGRKLGMAASRNRSNGGLAPAQWLAFWSAAASRIFMDLSCRAMVARGGFYVASAGAETGRSAFIRGSSRCGMTARSGLEDGERLAFGNHVVDLDQDAISACRPRAKRPGFPSSWLRRTRCRRRRRRWRRLRRGSAQTRPATSVTILISGIPLSGSSAAHVGIQDTCAE